MGRNHGRLSGKKVLVTGGTTGIGLEIAQRFIAEGAHVALTGRNPETLADAKSAAPDAGKIADQKALAARLKQEFGEVDAVVVNAGIGVFNPLEAWDEASFDRQMDTNFKGPFFLLQALAPQLSNSASIVLIASIAAHIGMAGQSVYSASKAALLTLMRNLPFEMNGCNVRVNSISPGPITTRIFGKLGLTAEAAEQFRNDISTKVPMGRFGTTREIADAAVFLASDESSYMLGSEIVVDGGMSRL